MEKTNRLEKEIVQIPINQGENLVHFPNKCVYCGGKPTKAWKLTVSANQEVGNVRRIFAQKAYLRTLAGVKTLTSTSRMAVPYCKEHFRAAWVEKWIFRGTLILAWLAGTRLIMDLFSNTFLAKGEWRYILFILALIPGRAFAGITLLVVQKAFSLVYPVINEIPANIFKGSLIGEIAGISIFSKSLFGITVNPKSLSVLELHLNNPQIASDLRKLNSGTPYVMTDIEIWPEPLGKKINIDKTSDQPQKKNKLANKSLMLGIAAIPLAIVLGLGAIFGVAAIISGWKARCLIRDSNDSLSGQSRATWGMIFGGIGFLLGMLIIIGIVVAVIKS